MNTSCVSPSPTPIYSLLFYVQMMSSLLVKIYFTSQHFPLVKTQRTLQNQFGNEHLKRATRDTQTQSNLKKGIVSNPWKVPIWIACLHLFSFQQKNFDKRSKVCKWRLPVWYQLSYDMRLWSCFSCYVWFFYSFVKFFWNFRTFFECFLKIIFDVMELQRSFEESSEVSKFSRHG